jgi:hypothetical protein
MASLNFNKVEEAFRTSLNAVPLRRIFKDYHRWTQMNTDGFLRSPRTIFIVRGLSSLMRFVLS